MSAKLQREYDRVTNVLFPFSGLNHVPPGVLKNAAERGSRVHEICAAITNHLGIIEHSPDLSGYLESFKQWCIDKTFVKAPGRLYCDTHMITGEIDALYTNEDGLILLDIKTSSKEGKTWQLQGSAYAYLLKLQGYNVNKIHFLQLSRCGAMPKLYEYSECFDLFLQCLHLYRVFFKDINEETMGDIF